jgi:hypothetical protein
MQSNRLFSDDRQFDAFKAQLSAQLKLSDSDRVWQEPQRPNYEDLRRADYRPSPKDLNARNISRLLLDETFFSQLLHHSQDTVRDADAEDISRTINGQVIDSKQTALTVGGPNSSSGRHLPPTWMKMVTVDEAVRSSRRFNRADISPGWRATYASDDDDIERRRATGGDEYGGHFDGRVADEETANCCDDAGSHQRCLMLTAGETPTTLPPIVETTVEHSSSTDISRASSASPQQRQSELRLPQIVK